MYIKEIFLAAALACGLVSAQTPPDAPSYVPATSNHLTVTYGSNDVAAGELMPLTETTSPPTISLPSPPGGKYTLIMIDPDARSSNGTPETVLHWLQSDLKGNTLPLVATKPAIAPYINPQPTAENPTRAHRYIQLLFRQTKPVKLTGPFANVAQVRFPFDFAAFMAQSGLGQIVAANYLLARNDSLVTTAFIFSA